MNQHLLKSSLYIKYDRSYSADPADDAAEREHEV